MPNSNVLAAQFTTEASVGPEFYQLFTATADTGPMTFSRASSDTGLDNTQTERTVAAHVPVFPQGGWDSGNSIFTPPCDGIKLNTVEDGPAFVSIKAEFTAIPELENAVYKNNFCGQVTGTWARAEDSSESFWELRTPSNGDYVKLRWFDDNSINLESKQNGVVVVLSSGAGTVIPAAGVPFDFRFKKSSTTGLTLWCNGVRKNTDVAAALVDLLEGLDSVIFTLNSLSTVIKTQRINPAELTDTAIEAWDPQPPSAGGEITIGGEEITYAGDTITYGA
jgi:hypothetical protein